MEKVSSERDTLSKKDASQDTPSSLPSTLRPLRPLAPEERETPAAGPRTSKSRSPPPRAFVAPPPPQASLM